MLIKANVETIKRLEYIPLEFTYPP